MLTYGLIFRMLSFSLAQRMNETLSCLELTFSQGHILGYLAHCPEPPCARDIEERFQLSHPTVSGLLSRLEKKGFLSQQPDPQDRRRKLLMLLPKGKACTDTMEAVIRQGDEALLRGFTPEERAQFRGYLTRALHNVSPDHPIPILPKEEFPK